MLLFFGKQHCLTSLLLIIVLCGVGVSPSLTGISPVRCCVVSPERSPMKTLEAAHINEDEYFSYRIHEDIDKIIRDIKEKHMQDAATADDLSPAEELRKQIEEVAAFEGSDDEKRAFLALHQLGINPKSLSKEEFVVLVNILKKSKKLNSPISKRGKSAKKRK